MDSSHSEYPALLTNLQPLQAITVLSDRVSFIKQLHTDIAEWLAERRQIEEAYAASLRKLASRRLEGARSLGVFQNPWRNILLSCETMADAHHMLSQKIASDVERPLYDYQSRSRELLALGSVQGNLAALAKDYDEAQKRAEKAQNKRGKTDQNKVTSMRASMQEASQQWETQAPQVFEQLQILDENRVGYLRDALTQLQTHDLDRLDKSRATAEAALNTLLNITLSDEISTFVAMTSEGPPPKTVSTRKVSRPSTGSATQPSNSIPNAPVPSMNRERRSSLAPPTSSNDDRQSEVSSFSPTPGQAPDKHKRGLGSGLKRLGTVMVRRNKDSNKIPDRPASPEKKTKVSRNPLKRGSTSRELDHAPSAHASMTELPDTSAGQGTSALPSPARRSTFMDSFRGLPSPSVLGPSSSFTNGSQLHADGARDSLPSPRAPRNLDLPTPEAGTSSLLSEIEQAHQEAAAENESQQIRLNIQNEPIRETDSEAQQALSAMADRLRAQEAALPGRKTGTVRGRRDVRNTIFVPSSPPPDRTAMPSGFVTANTTLPKISDDASNDTRSIRSSRSLGSLTTGAVRHPEMQQAGLNGSIVETVSAWFEGGRVTRSVVIGELALVHNSSEGGETSEASVPMRLDHFEVLEKIAPNPAFVTAAGKAGEYTLDTSSLRRTQVAFKYQVHLDEASSSQFAPVLLTPSWKLEPTQASVMLNYAPNPAFARAGLSSIALHNVLVIIHLEGTKAQSCQSKPAGIFSKDRNMIYWKLGDLELPQDANGSDASSTRLLARFATEGAATAGSVEARWELTSDAGQRIGSGLGVSVSVANDSSEPTGSETKPPGSSGHDPFADEGGAISVSASGSAAALAAGYRELSVLRKLVSGKYVAT